MLVVFIANVTMRVFQHFIITFVPSAKCSWTPNSHTGGSSFIIAI